MFCKISAFWLRQAASFLVRRISLDSIDFNKINSSKYKTNFISAFFKSLSKRYFSFYISLISLSKADTNSSISIKYCFLSNSNSIFLIWANSSSKSVFCSFAFLRSTALAFKISISSCFSSTSWVSSSTPSPLPVSSPLVAFLSPFLPLLF